MKAFKELLQKTVFLSICFIAGQLLFLSMASAQEPSVSARNYPGGADEQDLKVQPALQDPKMKTDRKTFEQKVMSNIFKKSSDNKVSGSEAKTQTNQEKNRSNRTQKKN